MITSSSNPAVKRVRALSAPAPTHRRAERAFVVEGVRAVEEALAGGAVPLLLLYEPGALGAGPRGRALLARVAKLPVAQEAGPAAFAAAADTAAPQGLLAVFPFVDWPPPAAGGLTPAAGQPAAPGPAPLHLVLDGIRDPGNLGTILRGAEAAGVTACWLTPDCVDLYNPKVVRAGAGVHFRLPCYPDQPWPEIREALLGLGIATRAALDAHGDQPYYRIDWRPPAALFVGNEAHGLSPAALQAATARVAIPMRGGTESLNAAMAAHVVLFEALRQRSLVPDRTPPA